MDEYDFDLLWGNTASTYNNNNNNNNNNNKNDNYNNSSIQFFIFPKYGDLSNINTWYKAQNTIF